MLSRFYQDALDFTRRRNHFRGNEDLEDEFDVKFCDNIISEFEEFDVSRRRSEQIDAVLDAMYYALQHSTAVKQNYRVVEPEFVYRGDLVLFDSCIELVRRMRISENLEERLNLLGFLAFELFCVLVFRFGVKRSEVYTYWSFVHKANMSKMTNGCKFKTDGVTVAKPVGFVPPDEALEEFDREYCMKLFG